MTQPNINTSSASPARFLLFLSRELKAYAKVENHEGLVVQGPGERLSMITSLNLLPDGDRLNLSVITKYGKTYLKLASG